MSEELYQVRQGDVSEETLKEIISLKNQYWVHPYESQKKWIEENLCDDDIHLLLRIDQISVAYLSICHVKITVDGTPCDMLGIGNVCVGREFAGKGLGRAIVLAANRIIMDKGHPGALLCHDALVGFYGRLGWKLLTYDTATLAGRAYEDNVMLLQDSEQHAISVDINKNF